MRALCSLSCALFLWASISPAADPASPVKFTEHLISKDYTYPFGVQAVDIDKDGDLDLTSADALPHNSLYWFENDGKGKFERHYIQQNDPQRLERHMIADVDADGDPDVVIVENLYGDLKWFENSGTPKDGKLWQRHYITQKGMPSAYDVAPVDIDGDGDLDVAASGWVGNSIAWFENDGTPKDEAEWKKFVVDDATLDPNLKETRTIRVGDFDGDKDPDLLATARTGGLVVWYENSGKPQTGGWKKHVINAAAGNPTHGHPVDIDADGDLDVVMAEGFGPGGEVPAAKHSIAWYENNGKPTADGPWQRHEIGPQVHAFEAFAVDLDGDKDLDVAATGWDGPGQVAWFENPGDAKGAWKRHLVKDNWTRANQIIAADLDADGRPDLVACAERGSLELRWWRNEK